MNNKDFYVNSLVDLFKGGEVEVYFKLKKHLMPHKANKSYNYKEPNPWNELDIGTVKAMAETDYDQHAAEHKLAFPEWNAAIRSTI